MLEIVNYNQDTYEFPCLLVMGCFDAIHEGHRDLFKKAKLQAKINGLDLGVMMFRSGKGGKQVYTFDERLTFLEQYNVKFVLLIDFTEEFKKTTASDFIKNIEDKLNVKGYMSGKDFRYGMGAKGKSSTLKNYAEDEENGVWYMPVKDYLMDGEKVSTTLIKDCLQQGLIAKANTLLGSQYFVTGSVVNGHGRGKDLGFPTANMTYPEDKVAIKQGVYHVQANLDGNPYQGIANYGARPTFAEDEPVLEVYFDGYEGDLYGKEISLYFVDYLRDIQQFDTPQALTEQLQTDIQKIRESL